MAHRDDESSAIHSAHRDRTPPAGSVTLDERLRSIEDMLHDLIESVGAAVSGNKTLELRVGILEKVVYGGVAVALLSVAGAVLALVLRSQPAAGDHSASAPTSAGIP